PVVWRRQAAALCEPAPFARGGSAGDPAPDRSPRTRQGGRRGGSLLMEIRVAPHGRHVAVVTIDHQPRRNAMTRQMLADLGRVWAELAQGDCRCIVLTGAGDRAFSAGADISGDLSARAETAQVVGHALLKSDPYPKPIVAAVNGDCVGGGVELLLSTDIRAAAPHARFGLPEARWPTYPFGGPTIRLLQQ